MGIFTTQKKTNFRNHFSFIFENTLHRDYAVGFRSIAIFFIQKIFQTDRLKNIILLFYRNSDYFFKQDYHTSTHEQKFEKDTFFSHTFIGGEMGVLLSIHG